MSKPILAYLGDNSFLPYHIQQKKFYKIDTSISHQFKLLNTYKDCNAEEFAFYKDYLSRLQMLHPQDQSIFLKNAVLRAGQSCFYIICQGNAWAFGKCDKYQLATGIKSIRLKVPVNLRSFSPQIKFSDISLSKTHGVGITVEQKIYGWGLIQQGNLPFQGQHLIFPTQISQKPFHQALDNLQIQCSHTQHKKIFGFREVHCSQLFTLYLYKNNVFVTGKEKLGRLGMCSQILYKVIQPMPISTPKFFQVASLACGEQFCLMLDTFGLLYGWGSNIKGQLGFPPTVKTITKPTKLSFIQQIFVKTMGCCTSASVIIDCDGNLITWGALIQNSTDYIRPKKIINKYPFKRISCGHQHILALDKKNNLFSWGSNKNGCILKQNKIEKIQKPVQINKKNEVILNFACGNNFSVISYQVINNQQQLQRELIISYAKQLIKKRKTISDIPLVQSGSRSPSKIQKDMHRPLKTQDQITYASKDSIFLNQSKLVQAQLQQMTKKLNQKNKSKLKKSSRKMISQKALISARSKNEQWQHRIKTNR